MSSAALGAVPRLVLIGGSDQAGTEVAPGKVKLSGNTDLWRLIHPAVPRDKLNFTPNFLRQSRRYRLDAAEVLVNLITDPDQNPAVLTTLAKALRGVPGRVINRPELVLRTTRDQVAARLHGNAGLRVPAVTRLDPRRRQQAERAAASLPFPVIFRRSGTHTGRIVGVMNNADQLLAALTEPGEHIATEFVDFRSPDGLYRKYRLFFIGDAMILRHMLVSDSWNVHAADRTRFMADRPELRTEEEALLQRCTAPFSSEVMAVFAEVRARMGLDFFGMDFGLLPDGAVLLFEANATMNFLPLSKDPRFAYLEHCLRPAHEAMMRMIDLSAPAKAGA